MQRYYTQHTTLWTHCGVDGALSSFCTPWRLSINAVTCRVVESYIVWWYVFGSSCALVLDWARITWHHGHGVAEHCTLAPFSCCRQSMGESDRMYRIENIKQKKHNSIVGGMAKAKAKACLTCASVKRVHVCFCDCATPPPQHEERGVI